MYAETNNNTKTQISGSLSAVSIIQRLLYIFCLSLIMSFVAFQILQQSNLELESIGNRVKSVISYNYDKQYKREDSTTSYDTLIGGMGDVFKDLWDDKGKDDDDDDDDAVEKEYPAESKLEKVILSNKGKYNVLEGVGNKENGTTAALVKSNESSNIVVVTNENNKRRHPHVICFFDAIPTCQSLLEEDIDIDPTASYAIPKKMATTSGKGWGLSSEDVTDLHSRETDDCKLSDISYQLKPAAPSNCNDLHGLPFRFGPTERQPILGINANIYPSNHQIKYLTSGGFRAVWTVKLLSDDEETESRVIMKTNRISRGWSSYYLDQNRRDILISEQAGSSPMAQSLHSNVLPVYAYCAFSSVVPFSTAGPLDEYVHERQNEGNLMTAEEQYLLAIQAARGLYQAQLYKNGLSTHVHADVKPPQFLLFDRPYQHDNSTTIQSPPPIMQLNDFNRGKFLTRNKDSETCSFTMCGVHHKGSTYRAPEEYMDCKKDGIENAQQDDRIDVFSLGGVFYYLLSDGEKPWYHLRSYDKAVKEWLNGEKPRLPTINEYSGEKTIAFVEKRSNHPAFVALKGIMRKCWAFKPKDRPSSFEVTQMLEKKWSEINAMKGNR